MITENSTKKTQARAFSYFAFVGNIGIFVGPFIGKHGAYALTWQLTRTGGALESPATKFPSTFGKVKFFREYPYAFPGFISASIGVSAAIMSMLFLKEVCGQLPHTQACFVNIISDATRSSQQQENERATNVSLGIA